jgi:hypothetical protein
MNSEDLVAMNLMSDFLNPKLTKKTNFKKIEEDIRNQMEYHKGYYNIKVPKRNKPETAIEEAK